MVLSCALGWRHGLVGAGLCALHLQFKKKQQVSLQERGMLHAGVGRGAVFKLALGLGAGDHVCETAKHARVGVRNS
jgi:hypothetical protein